MATPLPTTRANPTLLSEIYEHKDGHFSRITIEADTNIDFAEINPQPFGIDGGEPIEVVNMFNSAYRIKRARQLKELTPINATVHYVPAVLDQILAIVNVETVITNTFGDTGPNGSSATDKWATFGYLRSFTPQPLVEGQAPTANIVIQPTGWDHVNHVEAGPNWVSAQGTA